MNFVRQKGSGLRYDFFFLHDSEQPADRQLFYSCWPLDSNHWESPSVSVNFSGITHYCTSNTFQPVALLFFQVRPKEWTKQQLTIIKIK